MRHLPLELQLLVIENLGPKDIISLQLVRELANTTALLSFADSESLES
jgi:hypothetical protein